MTSSERRALRAFFDTSVVISGAFSQTGASYVLLQLADLGLIDGRISAVVRAEAERNVTAKLPGALPALRVLLDESLTEGEPIDPAEAKHDLSSDADPKDVPILAAAVAQDCRYLVTLNERDFWPPADVITIVRPGELLQRLREVVHELDIERTPPEES